MVVGIGIISVLCDDTWPLDVAYLFTGLSVFTDAVLDELRGKLASLQMIWETQAVNVNVFIQM